MTTSAYDGLGRLISETLPGETSGLTTATWTYVVTCGGAGSGPQTPCVRVDQTQRVDASTTVAAHAFYNGYGQLAESRTQAPGGQDVVRYVVYDSSGREIQASNPYFVAAWDGVTGFGYSLDDVNQSRAILSYDGLGRTLSSADPLGNATTTSYGVNCAVTSGDSSCYAATSVTDANAHQSQSFSDAYGRTTYTRDLSGNGGTGSPPIPYATYRTISATYDYAGNETAITQPDGSATSFTYDDAGRQLAMTDPDRGHETYAYDANSNVIQATDARNVSVYAGYDGLNRQLWRNTSNSPTGAYVSYGYDQSGHGASIGRLTSESFASPTDPSLTGSYSYSYDARGQITNSATTLLGTSYPTATTYDDAGEPLTLTYPDGAVASSSYSQRWLAGVSWTQNSVTTPLLAAVSYTGASGALGAITSATVGQSAGAALYHTTTQLDNDGRPTTTTLSRVSDGTTLYNESLSYDPVGNVSAVNTTLPQGTDHQLFCYDEQNRLTWAGTTSGNPCGNGAATGSFGAAGYTQSFGYDTLNRLTSGPLGSYSYGDSAHLHAATSVSSGYTASYDASGDMTCRAPSGSTTCAGGSPTGQQLTWDAEGRLAAWQNAPTSPTTTAKYLYDGEGARVVQQVTDSVAGTTTTTSYIGSLETVTSNGTTTTTTNYASAGSVLAESVNGTLSYLARNYQGSVVEALDGTGVVTASQLYAPYGGVRYANGALPTDYGYTGQRADASTGLDYYGARYYDPTLGQFTSADTLLAGGGDSLNRYGYVSGNPTTATDPSGHDPSDWLESTWNWLVQHGKQIAITIDLISQLVGYGRRHLPPTPQQPPTAQQPTTGPAQEQPPQNVYTPDPTDATPPDDPYQQGPTQDPTPKPPSDRSSNPKNYGSNGKGGQRGDDSRMRTPQSHSKPGSSPTRVGNSWRKFTVSYSRVMSYENAFDAWVVDTGYTPPPTAPQTHPSGPSGPPGWLIGLGIAAAVVVVAVVVIVTLPVDAVVAAGAVVVAGVVAVGAVVASVPSSRSRMS